MTISDFANRGSEVAYVLYYDMELGDETIHCSSRYDSFDDLLARIVSIRSGKEDEEAVHGRSPRTTYYIDEISIEIDMTTEEQEAIENAKRRGDAIRREEAANLAEKHAIENGRKERAEDEREYERLKAKLGKK